MRIRFLLLFLVVGLAPFSTLAENMDPANDDSQYAFGENTGWVNAEPSGDGGPGVQVNDEVVLLGSSGNEKISAELMAEWAESIHYEVIARINPQIPRIIV